VTLPVATGGINETIGSLAAWAGGLCDPDEKEEDRQAVRRSTFGTTMKESKDDDEGVKGRR
jgi:hypothetical protein